MPSRPLPWDPAHARPGAHKVLGLGLSRPGDIWACGGVLPERSENMIAYVIFGAQCKVKTWAPVPK